jgi:hypothetical protein
MDITSPAALQQQQQQLQQVGRPCVHPPLLFRCTFLRPPPPPPHSCHYALPAPPLAYSLHSPYTTYTPIDSPPSNPSFPLPLLPRPSNPLLDSPPTLLPVHPQSYHHTPPHPLTLLTNHTSLSILPKADTTAAIVAVQQKEQLEKAVAMELENQRKKV